MAYAPRLTLRELHQMNRYDPDATTTVDFNDPKTGETCTAYVSGLTAREEAFVLDNSRGANMLGYQFVQYGLRRIDGPITWVDQPSGIPGGRRVTADTVIDEIPREARRAIVRRVREMTFGTEGLEGKSERQSELPTDAPTSEQDGAADAA